MACRTKGKHEVPMLVSTNPDSIRGNPTDSTGTALYQPIGKARVLSRPFSQHRLSFAAPFPTELC